jgi:hypothetical protein
VTVLSVYNTPIHILFSLSVLRVNTVHLSNNTISGHQLQLILCRRHPNILICSTTGTWYPTTLHFNVYRSLISTTVLLQSHVCPQSSMYVHSDSSMKS